MKCASKNYCVNVRPLYYAITEAKRAKSRMFAKMVTLMGRKSIILVPYRAYIGRLVSFFATSVSLCSVGMGLVF